MSKMNDLTDKAMSIYEKVPKQSQLFHNEFSIILNNMIIEYNNLLDLLYHTEEENKQIAHDYEALKYEFDALCIQNEKLNKKLNSGITL